ncbi:MAG: hypothetical protein HYZ73_02620 [Elusimicrobia bacterium]|nr:hypothetical protein [Elusimicrobiota bacterium]
MRTRPSGGTLIEVLVTVAILAVGVGSLLVAITRGLQSAHHLITLAQARYEREAADLVHEALSTRLHAS